MITPESAAEAVALRERAVRRYRWAKNVALAMAVLVLVVGGGMLLVLSIESRSIAQNVESCIVPGGECYDRGERRRLQDKETQNRVYDIQKLLCRDLPENDPLCDLVP